MSAILLDTDIIIEVLRRRDTTILARWMALGLSEAAVYYTPVTAAELWQGMRPYEEKEVLKLLDAMTCVPITHDIGRTAGSYMQRYGPSHGLDLPDALIAATSVLHGCALWTRNRKHYPMPDLDLF